MALIEVDRVSFAYRKAPENPEAATKQAVNIPVLCDVSFKVESGELIALQGASGSGFEFKERLSLPWKMKNSLFCEIKK
jgi:ABC-type multidrug transport system fused ATPase/permease subunit